MAIRFSPQRTLRLIAPAGAVLLAFAGCGQDKSKPLQVPPAQYQRMVSAFYIGVTAMAEGDNVRALAKLREATQIVPQEPAAWADLALMQLRSRDLQAAASSLDKARELAPPNGRIELIGGLLASQQGRSDEALAVLRKAVELDPADPMTRYALIEELNRQGGPNADAEVKQQWEKIAAAQPDNLVALVELSRLAAKQGDAAQLRRQVDRLKAGSDTWPPEPKRQLAELERELGATDVRSLSTTVAVLGNLLRPTPPYQQSYAALKRADNAVGVPLERFLRLPTPSATPSPPDTTLTFVGTPLSEKAACARALPLGPEGTSVVLQAGAEGLTLRSAPPTRLPLPAGWAVPSPDGALAIDWNNDGKMDLALAGAGGVRLIQQASPTQWSDVTPRAGLPAAVVNAAYTGAWAADIELDGDLDIVLGAKSGPPIVLRNNGDGSWTPIHPFAGVTGLRAFAWADLDEDGDPDVALVDGAGRLVVFTNERAGHYRRLPDPPGTGAAQALSVADVNHDGTLDLVALRVGGAIQRLSLRPGGGWEAAELARWPQAPTDGPVQLLWADLDNNGAQDLVATGSRSGQVWLADGQGRLTPLPSPLTARALSAADLNSDGRLDLVGVTAGGAPIRLLNRGSKSYHWQVLRPKAAKTGDQRNNSFGVGGEIEVRAGLLYQKQPITGPRAQFGLGEYPAADAVRIVWPNGSSQGEFELTADKVVEKEQRLKGSCPWLFAYDGRSMRFVTDVLWKSPLGLRINAQKTAGVVTTRDWVKIRGDQLAARNGFYDLAITAELWETHFFDHVSLMTVDHPVGTEVFVDERFAIPPPPLAVQAMSPVEPVTRATDDRGQDVSEIVRARDGRYLDTFGRGDYQGVTRDHYVEVELPGSGVQAFRRSGVRGSRPERLNARTPERPNARTPERLILVASGWIHPTDSSINLALSQGRHAPPQGLSVEVPDSQGRWVTARAGVGFPAGKNKSVRIDLTGLLPARTTGPRRLRLRTNLEIYWDFLGVATSLPRTPLKVQKVDPQSAEVRYHGFSATRQVNTSSPEIPDYDRIAGSAPRWLDLIGFYTRFGDVRELLKKVDDRYVILNAGDEIALRFPAPPPPAAGWARDFVFVSDGWEKDGDFNTTSSKTVLPLPSHDQPAYDRLSGRLQDDPVYRRHPRDWELYHTRYVTPRPFRQALRPLAASGGR